MKRLLILLLSGILLLTTSCSLRKPDSKEITQEENAISAFNISNYWQFNGKNTIGNEITIDLNLEDSENFTMEILITDKNDLKKTYSAFASGNYTTDFDGGSSINPNQLSLSFEGISDKTGMIFKDDLAGNQINLPYYMEEEGIILTLTQTKQVFKAMPNEISFTRED